MPYDNGLKIILGRDNEGKRLATLAACRATFMLPLFDYHSLPALGTLKFLFDEASMNKQAFGGIAKFEVYNKLGEEKPQHRTPDNPWDERGIYALRVKNCRNGLRTRTGQYIYGGTIEGWGFTRHGLWLFVEIEIEVKRRASGEIHQIATSLGVTYATLETLISRGIHVETILKGLEDQLILWEEDTARRHRRLKELRDDFALENRILSLQSR